MENYKRKPNEKCKVCDKAMYKRPFEIESYSPNLYCTRECMFADRTRTRSTKEKIHKCPSCNIDFQARPKQVYCSKQCVGKATRNRLGTKKGYRKQKDQSKKRLEILQVAFKFTACMVEDCNYNKTFDIHRLIHGKNGGQYIIGNMFAICPNHHAECHRSLIVLKKVNDFTLISEELK